MANFAYIAGRGSLANWSIGTTISPSEAWHFERSIKASINGDGGGTWAPTSLITIGGSGLTISGPFTVTVAPHFTGRIYADEGLTVATGQTLVAHTLSLASMASVGGTLSAVSVSTGAVTASSADISGDCVTGTSSANDFVCKSTASFQGPVVIQSGTSLSTNATAPTILNGTLVCNNDVTLGSDASDDITVNGSINMGSTGTLALNQITLSITSSGYFSDTGVQIMRITGVTTSGLYLQSSANPRNGCLKIIKNEDLVNGIEIRNSDGSPLTFITASHAALMFADGTNWHMIMSGEIGGY